MPELFIDDDLHAEIPALEPDDYQALKSAIEWEGEITDPVLYWFDGSKNIIVDGVHRFKIAQELGIQCPAKEIGVGRSRNEIKAIAISRATDRRNLSLQARLQIRKIGIACRAKTIAKKISEEKPADEHKPKQRKEKDLSPKSRSVSNELGLSRATVRRAVDFHDLVEKLCTPARRAIESGSVVATEEELQALAELPEEEQIVIVRKVRVGQAAKIGDLIKALPKRKKKKPQPKLDPHVYWNQIDAKFGEVIRLIDKAADALNLPNDGTRSIIMDAIDNAMEYTREFLGVPEES